MQTEVSGCSVWVCMCLFKNEMVMYTYNKRKISMPRKLSIQFKANMSNNAEFLFLLVRDNIFVISSKRKC